MTDPVTRPFPLVDGDRIHELHTMAENPTLVLGASPDPGRYAHMAVDRLVANDRSVIAVGKRNGNIGTIPIMKDIPDGAAIDTVTLYLNPSHQKEWYDRILDIHPRRIIFNPGAENKELAELASGKGIEVINGCTLVMLAAGTY